MNQDRPTCKTFDDAARAHGGAGMGGGAEKVHAEQVPGANWALPEALRTMIAGRELVCGLDAIELREMSKFTERPNVWGLAAHPILRPAGAWCQVSRLPGEGSSALSEAGDGPGWDDRVHTALGRLIGMFPLVCVRGWLGAGEAVQVFAPQNHARLAAGFAKLMRPLCVNEAPPPAEALRTLVIWPEPPCDKRGRALMDRVVGQWPSQGLTIVIGTDDFHAAASLLGLELGGRLRAVEELADDAFERKAALAVGTMLFGVEVDALGRIPVLEHGGGAKPAPGWVVM